MNYIFVFLGEFGYELLNWQGVIRKFATTINRTKDRIVVCSREGLEPFYEYADEYISISELSYFKNSAASMYWAHSPEINYYKHHSDTISGKVSSGLMSTEDRRYQKKLKDQIKDFVLEKLQISIFNRYINRNYKFVFSSDYQVINGLVFGTDSMSKARIYEDLDLNNNLFVKVESCKGINVEVEKKLGFSLSEPYFLCQTGARDVIQRSKKLLEYKVLDKLSRKMKIVLLNFDTGRNLDSKSVFPDIKNCYVYNCGSFKEQSVLIENSQACVFFTEGDFRSHNYLPPFMGRNVYSIAAEDIFEIGTTPIKFWNNNVFRFGGQIIPICFEDIDTLEDLIDKGI